MKRILKALALTVALALLPALSLAEEDFGSAAVGTQATYTLAEMLAYAMQDEYLAEAEYIAIQEAFGADNPFANIMGAETTHQETLLRLFEAYGIALPENTAAEHVVLPQTLQETYEVGVQAEISNMAMYAVFLAQEGLPQDVVNAFTALMNASQSHLEAFTRNAENDGVQLNLGDGNQYGQDGDDKGNGNSSDNSSGYQTANSYQEANGYQNGDECETENSYEYNNSYEHSNSYENGEPGEAGSGNGNAGGGSETGNGNGSTSAGGNAGGGRGN